MGRIRRGGLREISVRRNTLNDERVFEVREFCLNELWQLDPKQTNRRTREAESVNDRYF